MPGVRSVAIVDTFPMREGNNTLGYWPTADVPPEKERPLTLATSVSPEYFNVMGIPLRQGRYFSEQDRMGGEPAVVIDEVLAQQAFGGGQNAIGKRLWMPDMGYGPFVVVGVVGHVRHWGWLATIRRRSARSFTIRLPSSRTNTCGVGRN